MHLIVGAKSFQWLSRFVPTGTVVQGIRVSAYPGWNAGPWREHTLCGNEHVSGGREKGESPAPLESPGIPRFCHGECRKRFRIFGAG